MRLIAAFFLAYFAIAEIAVAAPLAGEKNIILVEADGTGHSVATIAFTQNGNKSSYSIDWTDKRFAEHFLSMRPFRCLEGSEKYWCRVPYPYPIRREVSVNDLTDLEYDTMFIWKGSTEYGINMWNGVYYRLQIEGDRLVGELHEIDMDTLSAPPDEGNLRPVREQDLEPGEPESHWLPKIIIE